MVLTCACLVDVVHPKAVNLERGLLVEMLLKMPRIDVNVRDLKGTYETLSHRYYERDSIPPVQQPSLTPRMFFLGGPVANAC